MPGVIFDIKISTVCFNDCPLSYLIIYPSPGPNNQNPTPGARRPAAQDPQETAQTELRAVRESQGSPGRGVDSGRSLRLLAQDEADPREIRRDPGGV